MSWRNVDLTNLAAVVDDYLASSFFKLETGDESGYLWLCKLQFALDCQRGATNPDFGKEARDYLVKEGLIGEGGSTVPSSVAPSD